MGEGRKWRAGSDFFPGTELFPAVKIGRKKARWEASFFLQVYGQTDRELKMNKRDWTRGGRSGALSRSGLVLKLLAAKSGFGVQRQINSFVTKKKEKGRRSERYAS